MSSFGSTLFNGSRFIFWSLGPICLLCGIGFLCAAPLAFAGRDWKAGVTCSYLGVMGVCFFLALLNGRKFPWAARVVTGLVALFFVLYFLETYFIEDKRLTPSARRSESSPWGALMGFLVVGLPCVWFTVHGRFGSDEAAEHANDESKSDNSPSQ